jgi:hypothetical protein
MVASWVIDELRTSDLGDQRLDRRFAEVLGQLSGQASASIPAACGGYAETAAAYRLFDNDKATADKVLAPHGEATRRRMAAQAAVVLVQDTTEIDVTRPERQMAGAGPLDGGPRRGLLLHALHAFTPDGTALGTLYHESWTRAEGEPKAAYPKGYKSLPFEQKETRRWLTTLRQAQAAAAEMPQTAVVAVADSEADIYEVLAAGQDPGQRLDWIVRAAQDRATTGRPAGGPEKPMKSGLWDQVLAAPVLAAQSVLVRGRTAKVACEDRGRRQSRESRPAAAEVRAAAVTLRPPWRNGGRLPVITVNAVLVSEPAPPAGEPAVEWLLLTSLPIGTPDEVRRVIQLYCVRWMIEVFFRTLKSGCRVEARRFEQVDRFRTCLAVYMIVAWRTLFACRLGREFPDMSCEAIFEPAEWKAAYRVVKGEPPPAEPPRLKEMIRIVAQLGGYVYRKRTDDPGPQTVGRGLQRVHDLALCWNLFGPGAVTEDV